LKLQLLGPKAIYTEGKLTTIGYPRVSRT